MSKSWLSDDSVDYIIQKLQKNIAELQKAVNALNAQSSPDENFYIYPPHYNTQGYKYVGRGSCDENWSQEAPNGNRTSSIAPIWNLNIGANKLVPKSHY